MSNILRKAENLAHPERREYYDAAAGHVADPSAPRTGAAMHGGAAPGTRVGASAVGSEYTTGHPHPHEHLNHTQGKHGYMQYGRTPASGPAPTTAGPHTHDFMNKLDPRVDSTADHRPVVNNPNAHHSKIANVLDPRVDSTVANDPYMGGGASGMHGAGMTGTGAGVHHGAGAGIHAGAVHPTAGPGHHTAGHHTAGHQTAGHHTAGAGHHAPGGVASTGTTGFQASLASGPASRTAGPHKSNLMNKLDPAVDSKTGATTGTTGASGPTMGAANTTGVHGTHHNGMTRY